MTKDEALRWYADPETWKQWPHADQGDRARMVLTESAQPATPGDRQMRWVEEACDRALAREGTTPAPEDDNELDEDGVPYKGAAPAQDQPKLGEHCASPTDGIRYPAATGRGRTAETLPDEPEFCQCGHAAHNHGLCRDHCWQCDCNQFRAAAEPLKVGD